MPGGALLKKRFNAGRDNRTAPGRQARIIPRRNVYTFRSGEELLRSIHNANYCIPRGAVYPSARPVAAISANTAASTSGFFSPSAVAISFLGTSRINGRISVYTMVVASTQ